MVVSGRPDGGRFAPSPSGVLHLGNLRTAVLAWLFARSEGRQFLIRMEDLDRVAVDAEAGQLRDLEALGVDHDGVVVHQSERGERYAAVIDTLVTHGLTYDCYCTRREIREAASAPQSDGRPAEGRYPGTCRTLTVAETAARREAGRRPALRLDAGTQAVTFMDRLHGPYTGEVEDIVLRRNDGLAAYNLAVVVDDAAQGVGQIVRGADLLPVTPSQVLLTGILGLPVAEYAHVPLALNQSGQRLAKRDGAVTLPDLRAQGWSAPDVLGLIAASLGLSAPRERVSTGDLLNRFDPGALPRAPWIVDPAEL